MEMKRMTTDKTECNGKECMCGTKSSGEMIVPIGQGHSWCLDCGGIV